MKISNTIKDSTIYAGVSRVGAQVSNAVSKCALAILPILGSSHFPAVRPFGVEEIFGKTLEKKIETPTTVDDVQRIVKDARAKNETIAVLGAGMSQGTQTVPTAQGCLVSTQYLNHIRVNAEDNTVTVGSGATWEEVQKALDKEGKSAIVKQASDLFSIGGSIGINCHGWAHEVGTIAKTVRSITMVDANGDVRHVAQGDPLFSCLFGTLGYFGIIVEATFDVVPNDVLIEEAVLVDRDQFQTVYEQEVKGRDRPLFRGRIVPDLWSDDPLREIYLVSYRKAGEEEALAPRVWTQEPKQGTLKERIALKLISYVSLSSFHSLTKRYWDLEKKVMQMQRAMTRNEALHPPINAMKILHNSKVHAEWLQEYFVEKEKLPAFLQFLGSELKASDVKLVNASVRPVPQDDISILPYAEKERYAVVLCFAQEKTDTEIAKTRAWMERVNAHLARTGGVFYQAYMPYATVAEFEACYGKERIEEMRRLKEQFDPQHLFGNAHTAKYYDQKESV